MNTTEQDLRSALEEALLQIEYLHDKFQETGTGNQVLSKIAAALSLPNDEGWIKVEEGCEMPEQKYKVAGNSYSETVLVFDGYSYDLATSEMVNESQIWLDVNERKINDITHWKRITPPTK